MFLALSYNKVANWHTHIVNGVIIQHAHTNSDDSHHHHSHSKKDFLVLNIINSHFWSQIQTQFLPPIFETTIIPYIITDLIRLSYPQISSSNKSPPVK